MNMITRHLPGNDLELVFHRDLPQDGPDPNSHWARQHPLAILGNPDQMHFQIRLRMCPDLVTSHSDTYYLHFA